MNLSLFDKPLPFATMAFILVQSGNHDPRLMKNPTVYHKTYPFTKLFPVIRTSIFFVFKFDDTYELEKY